MDLLGDCWVTGRPAMQPASQLTPDTANHHASLSPPTTTTSRTTTPKRPRIFTRHHAAVLMPARFSLRLPIVYTVGLRRRSSVITVLSSQYCHHLRESCRRRDSSWLDCNVAK